MKWMMKPWLGVLTAWAALVGCGEANENGGEDKLVCIDDGDQKGMPCLQKIETEAQFESIATEGQGVATKFMLPVTPGPDTIPLVFQNSRRYVYHIEFLKDAFPEKFGNLTPTDYIKLIYNRATRSYYSGVIMRQDDVVEGRLYGFNVWTDLSDPAEQLEMKEIRNIYEAIHKAFLPEKLVYMPTDDPAVAKARSWIDPDFPVFLGWNSVTREVYTQGVCYGRVRRFTLENFEMAINGGELGWQDIVVIDRVPFDIETVVAGVVTGGRQWELNHVNVRMARRGTPNLYVKDALEQFKDLDGKLIKLEAIKSNVPGGDDRFTKAEVTEEEANTFWTEHRPKLQNVPEVEATFWDLKNIILQDLSTDPTQRIGGKAGNLAKLYHFLPAPLQVPAFAIPFAYFEDFMMTNRIVDQRVNPPEEVNLREYVSRLIKDEKFNTDTKYRRDLLWDLRTRMEKQAEIKSEWVAQIVEKIIEVHGGTNVKVRFRSSSNVEDALEFSGAGLYTSISVCADDSLDGDLDGPSHCDLSQDEERSIERGLRTIWASLYNTRAWEERDWYQVPQERASMAILVSLAVTDEMSNGVVFTGNPLKTTDNRFLVNAQLGDEPVVGNDPQVVPEMDLLKIDETTGEVSKITRSRSSPLSEPGSYVLSDSQLKQLGALVFSIDRDYPQETGSYLREQVLLDLEFKFTEEGNLKIKQIRPFLDKCRTVVCNQPGPNVCKDANTLLEVEKNGTCDPSSGQCRYDVKETACNNGCEAGQCNP